MGFDAISYVATGKSTTDHAVSLVMGEDCALLRILEGELCQKPHLYEQVAVGTTLGPLPVSAGAEQLAAADPEVRAAIERAAQYAGWAGGGVQMALLPGGFIADDVGMADLPVPPTRHEEGSGLSLGALVSSLADSFSRPDVAWDKGAPGSGRGDFAPAFERQRGAPLPEQAARPAEVRQAPQIAHSFNREVGQRPVLRAYGDFPIDFGQGVEERAADFPAGEIGG